MQRVTSRESLATPAATPAEHALDDEPTGSNSKQVANQIGSITHDDDGVEKAYNETDVIVNGLHPDIGDLSLDLGTQRPPLDSPRTKETSQRSTVPVGSTIVDGAGGPFIANNKHVDESLQGPVDEFVEQPVEDNQPNGPTTGSGRLETGTLSLGEYSG